jgi:16S rRNA (guanine(966)-N(2))-methyltransferase RsmD
MRIISGILKGRRYDVKLPPGIRPTTDSSKETVFNILSNLIDLEDAIVCDLCAGTGSLGFEAISRGAKFCTFVDISSKAISYIESAADHFKLSSNYFETVRFDATKFLTDTLPDENGVYELILLDPPYEKRIGNQIIGKIIRHNYLKVGGIILAESAVGDGVSLNNDYQIVTHKTMGSTQFHFIERIK